MQDNKKLPEIGINLADLVGKAKSAEPKHLSGLSDKHATLFLRASFSELAKSIDGTTEGVVKVQSFGGFHRSSWLNVTLNARPRKSSELHSGRS